MPKPRLHYLNLISGKTIDFLRLAEHAWMTDLGIAFDAICMRLPFD